MIIVFILVFSIPVCVFIYKALANKRAEDTAFIANIKMEEARDYCEKKELYLARFKNHKDYKKLAIALNELPIAYNRWSQEILSTAPMIKKKPLDPTVACATGTAVGGLVDGVAMGVVAEKEAKDYQQEVQRFHSDLAKIQTAEKRVDYLLDIIRPIVIEKNDFPAESDNSKRSTTKSCSNPEDIKRKVIMLDYLLSNGSSTVIDIILEREELNDVRKTEGNILMNQLLGAGYVTQDEKNNYCIADKERSEEYIRKNILYYKKYDELTKEEKEYVEKEMKEIILSSMEEKKWYSNKEIRELNGMLRSMSAQRMSAILNKLVLEKKIKQQDNEYMVL